MKSKCPQFLGIPPNLTGEKLIKLFVCIIRLPLLMSTSSGCHLDDQPITPCHGPLVIVADDEVVQQ